MNKRNYILMVKSVHSVYHSVPVAKWLL